MMSSMKRIGIDQQSGDIYESYGNYWRIISPAPILFSAILNPKLPVQFEEAHQISRYIFREDDFDPVVRVRRGRFYERAQTQQPSDQFTLPNPAGEYFDAPRRGDGLYRKSLFSYDFYQLTPNTPSVKFVALGTPESLWRVVARPERVSTGEFLFMLKARNAFGVLPELNVAVIPELGRNKVIETLETLTDAAHRADPNSVIDRARDATQCCLATWAAEKFEDSGLLTKDLGAMVKKIEKDKWTATRAAEVVRVLHSNAKPNEQERHGSRSPMEDDAELAVKVVGLIVRELGWDL